jgi:putative MATE family efflux protein
MRSLIGDRKFYKHLFAIILPMMVQFAISTFVGLLDNIMLGQVGTEEMSGAAIANQFMFIYNISLFGLVSGAGIFSAQFFGAKDNEGVRDTFRFKVVASLIMTIFFIFIFSFFGKDLISLFLLGKSQVGDVKRVMALGNQYLLVCLLGLIPYAITNSYADTLRATGETVLPMAAGIVAVLTNTVFNWILIFGNLGFPKLGMVGAAVATVISRFVEGMILIIHTYKNRERNQFIIGAYKSMKVPANLLKSIFRRGMPLFINEVLWAIGTSTLLQCYSMRGFEVVASINISNTLANFFNIVYFSMGNAVSIIVGQLLGEGKFEEAKDTDKKLIAFAVMSCLVCGGILFAISGVFPQIYKTEPIVKTMASVFIMITAICMPIQAFIHTSYFTLRCGGRTFIAFLFDSMFVLLISVPLAFSLVKFTGLNIFAVYLICQLADILKAIFGFVLIKKGIWINNIVDNLKDETGKNKGSLEGI